MEIKQMIINPSLKRVRPGIKMTPTYITIHETANTEPGATALAHAKLLARGGYETVASWHFTVDDKEIWQSIPENEVAWHAGKREGNYHSIGIEMCVNKGGNYEQTLKNTIELVKYLMKKWNIPVERVVPHKYWTGKDCPHFLLASKGFDWFRKQLVGSAPATQPQAYDNNANYHRLIKLTDPMMKGEDVKRVQQRLVQLGYKLDVDGIYGPKTKAAVEDFQKKHGLAVDGIVGPKTWNALFVTHWVVISNGTELIKSTDENQIWLKAKEAFQKGAKEVIIRKL